MFTASNEYHKFYDMWVFFYIHKEEWRKVEKRDNEEWNRMKKKSETFFYARIEVDWVLSIPIYWNAVDYKIIEIFLFIASAFLFYFSRFMSSWDIYGWINFISHLFTASLAVVMEWRRDRLNDMWDIENYRGRKEEKILIKWSRKRFMWWKLWEIKENYWMQYWCNIIYFYRLLRST